METKNKTTLKPSPLPFIFMNDTEGFPAAICRNVCVEWVNLSEGVSGDYDPQDPDDVNLLRYDAYVYEAGSWNNIENASYCTCMPADAEPELLGRAAAYMARELAKALADPNRSVKMVAGKLSWLGDGDFSDEKQILWEKNIPLPERAPLWIDYKKQDTQYFHKDSKTAKILENVLHDPNDCYFVERRFIFCPKCNNGQQSETVCECCGAPIDMEKAYSLSNSTTYEEAYRVLHDVTKVYAYKKGTRLVTVMRSQQWEPSAQALRVYPAYRLHITIMDMETGALRLRVVTQRGTKSKPVGQNYNIVLEAPCISQLDKFPELIEALRKELSNYYNLAENDVPDGMADILRFIRYRGSMNDYHILEHLGYYYGERWFKDRRNLLRHQKKGSAEYQHYLFGNAPKSIRRMILNNPYIKFAYEFMTDSLGFQNVDIVRTALRYNWLCIYYLSLIMRAGRDRENNEFIWAAKQLAREYPDEKQRLRYWMELFEELCMRFYEGAYAEKTWHMDNEMFTQFIGGVKNLSKEGVESPFQEIWNAYTRGSCYVKKVKMPLYTVLDMLLGQRQKYGSLNAPLEDAPSFADVQQDGYKVRGCRAARDVVSLINKFGVFMLYYVSDQDSLAYVGVYEGHTPVQLLVITEGKYLCGSYPLDPKLSLMNDAVKAWVTANNIKSQEEWRKVVDQRQKTAESKDFHAVTILPDDAMPF